MSAIQPCLAQQVETWVERWVVVASQHDDVVGDSRTRRHQNTTTSTKPEREIRTELKPQSTVKM